MAVFVGWVGLGGRVGWGLMFVWVLFILVFRGLCFGYWFVVGCCLFVWGFGFVMMFVWVCFGLVLRVCVLVFDNVFF